MANDTKMGLQQEQSLQMRQILAPQQLLGLELLQLSNLELEERIQQEVIDNPMLSLQEDEEPASNNDQHEAPHVDRDAEILNYKTTASLRENDVDEDIRQNLFGDEPAKKLSANGDFDSKAYIEAQSTEQKSLHEHLYLQLYSYDVSDMDLQYCSYLISKVNQDGYCICDWNAFSAFFPSAAETDYERSMSLLQQMDPPGVCARDISECILIQINQHEYSKDEESEMLANDAKALLTHYSHHFKKQDRAKIASVLGVSYDWVDNIYSFIRRFEPIPGRLFSGENAYYIYPDIEIKRHGDDLQIFEKNELVTKLEIDDLYYDMYLHAQKKSDEKKYLHKHYNTANQFLHLLERRQATLLKVTAVIVDKQHDFFLYGPSAMKPLRLLDVAYETQLHESTISRVVMNKYIQTDWGVFRMKYFFSGGGTSSETGKSHSPVSVKERMKSIIEEYKNKKKKISDQKIMEILKADGINVARRTVNKYRHQL